ncbi:MAG: TlpA disulfide reductase family protein [Odoribacter sp.]
MRNLIYGAAIFVAACFSCASPIVKDYVVEGEIKGFGDGMLYVMTETLDGYANDTAFVKNDRFTFRSSTEHPVELLFMVADNKACDRCNTYSFGVFVENSSTPIVVKAEVEKRIENAVITGSIQQQQVEQIEATGMFKKLRRLQREKDSFNKVNDTIALEEKNRQFKQLVNVSLDELFAFDFARNSVAVTFVLYKYFPFLSVDELENTLRRFDQTLESSVYLEKMQERIRRSRVMAVGQKAPEFTLQDTTGHSYHLSDFKGKMVLLDFTASWCHWCKVEIPYIEQIHQKMKGKNFEIISVYLDKNREDWVKDVKTSQHPWKCLSDVMAWKKGGMAYDYFVNGIPALVLLDQEGRIISKGTRGEKTMQVVIENYK